MKTDCIIVGAGTYGQTYAKYLKEEYNILGFIDDNEDLHNKFIDGIKVLGGKEYLFDKISKQVRVFVPIGNNEVRIKYLNELRQNQYITPSYIHHTVNIHSDVHISDDAVYILQGTIIMPCVNIERGVMISSGTIISHHTKIEEGVFISFGVNVGASLTLKEKAYIGIGSIIMTGIEKVGAMSLVGAGAVVIRDVPDNAVVVGNPAKVIKYKK